jgi:hypothetical protein
MQVISNSVTCLVRDLAHVEPCALPHSYPLAFLPSTLALSCLLVDVECRRDTKYVVTHNRGYGVSLIATGYEQIVLDPSLDPAINVPAELVLAACPKGRYVLLLTPDPIY